MKKFSAIIVAATLSCLAGAAQAQNFYVGGYGAMNYTHDGNANGNEKMVYDPGYGVGAVGGYVMGNGIRLEGEIAYRSNGVDTLDGVSVGADMTSWAFMGNVLYDFNTQSSIRPHIGGGLGIARGTIETGSLEYSDTVFAAQFIVGVDYMVAPDLALTLDLRHMRTQDLSLGAGSGLGGVEYTNSSLAVGLRKSF
ncbi:MAG: porin family protein [Proteobacteria bacterium]|nr:porin family protein [Pseudomonadota bacterium]